VARPPPAVGIALADFALTAQLKLRSRAPIPTQPWPMAPFRS